MILQVRKEVLAKIKREKAAAAGAAQEKIEEITVLGNIKTAEIKKEKKKKKARVWTF